MQFLPGSSRVDIAIWMHYMDATKQMEKKLDDNYTRSNIEQVLEATPHKAAALRPTTTYHENYQS